MNAVKPHLHHAGTTALDSAASVMIAIAADSSARVASRKPGLTLLLQVRSGCPERVCRRVSCVLLRVQFTTRGAGGPCSSEVVSAWLTRRGCRAVEMLVRGATARIVAVPLRAGKVSRRCFLCHRR